MPNHAGNDQGVPDTPVRDDVPAADANRVSEVSSVREKQLRLVFTFPIILGLFIWALNLLAVIRIWRTVYFSSLGMLARANLPNTLFFTLITTSLFIGLVLVGYAMALRQYDGYSQEIAPPQANRISYVKWLVVPILIFIPGPALTAWAAAIVQPITAKPCIEIYQEALNIQKDNPNFKMVWNDRDELRCSVNDVLRQ